MVHSCVDSGRLVQLPYIMILTRGGVPRLGLAACMCGCESVLSYGYASEVVRRGPIGRRLQGCAASMGKRFSPRECRTVIIVSSHAFDGLLYFVQHGPQLFALDYTAYSTLRTGTSRSSHA